MRASCSTAASRAAGCRHRHDSKVVIASSATQDVWLPESRIESVAGSAFRIEYILIDAQLA